MNTIEARSFEPSPIEIEVDFTTATGATTATVTMHSSTATISGENIHLILIEDDVNTTPATYDHTYITRAVYSEPISLAGQWDTAVVTNTFAIDPSWVNANLRVIALVQLASYEVLQAASSDPLPPFKIRGMVPFSRTEIGPSSAVYETDPVTMMNIGMTDTFTIDIVIDTAPAGWTAEIRDSGGVIHTGPLAFGLAADAQTTFTAVVTPASSGYMRYHIEVTSPNLARPLEIPFTYITDDVQALIIDDDGGESYEDYFTEALDSAGLSYGVWDRAASPLTTEVADNFGTLVWNAGWAFPTLDDDDRTFLGLHLDAGKRLFLSGQDIGWELNTSTAGNYDPTWYESYLHAQYVRDDTNIMDIDGVPGDPITDGLDLHIDGGTGASNQDYPDEVRALGLNADIMLNYRGDGGAAVRSVDTASGAKVVYLGFGFEGIDNADDRRDLLGPSLDWLQDAIFRDGFESGMTSAWSFVTP
jgi:hypothetical protein